MKKIEELTKGRVNDIITLSDFQTSAEFEAVSVDFRISAIRSYKDPDDTFTITAYELEGPNEDTPFMLLIKEVGDIHDVYVYYIDTDGEFNGDSDSPYLPLLTEDRQDLTERLEVTVHYEDGEKDITWDIQSQAHGVRYSDSNNNEGVCTLAEYFTRDDNNNNSFCLIDWRGDDNSGWIELWYGCNIKDHEVQVTPIDE